MKCPTAESIRGNLTKSELLKYEGSWVLVRSGRIDNVGYDMQSVVSQLDTAARDYIVMYVSNNPIW